ncbi:YcnI family copper-binding membrane protein [Streptomyces sp. 4N509B]|uniref:YcnI family copper-binding membrane protein n=1 Tax=Streptomyces sp. 4N509B TaxID=3457413 RepID=UPI003FD0A3C5
MTPTPTSPSTPTTTTPAPAPTTAGSRIRTSTGVRTAARVLALTAAASAVVLTFSAPAQAHVSITPGEAQQGGYATINVKVPNERDDASTVGLELHLDPDHPLASVMPQPVPGWDVEVETGELDEPIESHGTEITEAPATVVWTATGDGIEPGTFQQFPLSVGQLPEDADRLVLDAIQTYDSGEVVRWIEEPVEGEEEPESPSPVLQLTPAEAESGTEPADADAAADANADADAEAVDDTTTEASSDGDASDTTARVLGVVGILVGLGGVAFGVLASRRRA